MSREDGALSTIQCCTREGHGKIQKGKNTSHSGKCCFGVLQVSLCHFGYNFFHTYEFVSFSCFMQDPYRVRERLEKAEAEETPSSQGVFDDRGRRACGSATLAKIGATLYDGWQPLTACGSIERGRARGGLRTAAGQSARGDTT